MIFDPSIGDWFQWDDPDHGWDEAEWCPAFLADPDNIGLLWKYLSLITSEHNQMPRFMRTVALWVTPIIEGLRVVKQLETLFDVDTATGNALDATGRWVGLSRRIVIQNTNWFSWDNIDEPRGWEESPWSSPFVDQHEVVVLDDEHYRLVLKARIAANHWDGTRQGAYDAWGQYFGPLGYQVLIQDNYEKVVDFLWWDEPNPAQQWDNSYWDKADFSTRGRCTGNMHMLLALVGPPPDALTVALLAGGYFDLRPAGVGMDYMVTQSGPGTEDGYPLFAWDMGPEEPPSQWFSWDEEALGWDEAPWYPADQELWFTWDSDPMLGWDNAHWHPEEEPEEHFWFSWDMDPEQGWDAGEWHPEDGGLIDSWFSWDMDARLGWDNGEWFTGAVVQPLFTLDGTAAQGFDRGVWAPLISGAMADAEQARAAAQTQLDALRQQQTAAREQRLLSDTATSQYLAVRAATLFAGWDIGAWGKEVPALHLAASAEFADAAE